jgi:hypothetical protein
VHRLGSPTMFGRKKPDAPAEAADTTPDSGDARAPKGRPTPSRKEAEAARKQQLRIPKDPKAAKKAARERDREERGRARAGMLAGDERYLPARDRGPAKAFTRDFVDSRFTIAEFFIFVAIAVLVLGFVRNPAVQSFVTLAFFAFALIIIVDTGLLLFSLDRKAKAQFPNKPDRKGILLYATLRTIQLRRLRMPPPRVRRGGAPIAR